MTQAAPDPASPPPPAVEDAEAPEDEAVQGSADERPAAQPAAAPETYHAWVAIGGEEGGDTVKYKALCNTLKPFGVKMPRGFSGGDSDSDAAPEEVTFSDFAVLAHEQHDEVYPPGSPLAGKKKPKECVYVTAAGLRDGVTFVEEAARSYEQEQAAVAVKAKASQREAVRKGQQAYIPGRPGIEVKKEAQRIEAMRGKGKRKHIHPSERLSARERNRQHMNATLFQEELLTLFSPEVRLALAAASAKKALGSPSAAGLDVVMSQSANDAAGNRQRHGRRGVGASPLPPPRVPASPTKPPRSATPTSKPAAHTYTNTRPLTVSPASETLRAASLKYGPPVSRVQSIPDPYDVVGKLLGPGGEGLDEGAARSGSRGRGERKKGAKAAPLGSSGKYLVPEEGERLAETNSKHSIMIYSLPAVRVGRGNGPAPVPKRRRGDDGIRQLMIA
eukprot:TRINITY_DN5579_c0_g1_i1.p1 TRINITY_DN5579_c0_g1~~TRINITY_DN5579_c0_g1_i1.p1  ORF type:complete len:462 (+),score=150.99 TRINITY_DN5579_c0_g1_i1:50-1387(+)